MGNMGDMQKQGMLPLTKKNKQTKKTTKPTKYLHLCMHKLPQLSVLCSFGKNVIVSQKTELILCALFCFYFCFLKLTFVVVYT